MQQSEPGHRARNARSEVADRRLAGNHLTLGVEIELPGSGRGRLFAKIDGGRAAIREGENGESTAADVAGPRIGHGEREPDRDGSVRRVSAFFRISTPTSEASSLAEATMPCSLSVGAR